MRTWRSTGHGAAQLGTTRRAWRSATAGGNLAAIAARHWPAAGAQLLVYLVNDGDGHRVVEHGDFPMLTAEAAEFCWRYLREADRAAPDVSPLKADDLRGCRRRTSRSPASTSCVTRGSSTPRRSRPRRAVALRNYDDMPHGFVRWGGVADRARELIAELGDHARGALRRRPRPLAGRRRHTAPMRAAAATIAVLGILAVAVAAAGLAQPARQALPPVPTVPPSPEPPPAATTPAPFAPPEQAPVAVAPTGPSRAVGLPGGAGSPTGPSSRRSAPTG